MDLHGSIWIYKDAHGPTWISICSMDVKWILPLLKAGNGKSPNSMVAFQGEIICINDVCCLSRALHCLQLSSRKLPKKVRRSFPGIQVCISGTSHGPQKMDRTPTERQHHDKDTTACYPLLSYPLVMCYSLLLKMAIEIVDLPMKNMVMFHRKLLVYQRVYHH